MPRGQEARLLRRSLRLLVRFVLLALSVALGLELAVRFLVLSEVSAGWSLARRLREPSLHGRSIDDDLYWEMQFRGLPPDLRVDNPTYDPELGWLNSRVRGPRLEHVREGQIGARRLVLLFGDSYAQGAAEVEGVADFGALLEASPLAQDWVLLNYGIGGYGLDQILMLMRRGVARHRSRSPVVVVSLLVDDDIDRCVLTFRSWPKPRLELVDGALVEPAEPVPRVQQYLGERSSLPASLSWHLVERGLGRRGTSRDGAERVRLKRELGAAILRAMVAELRAEALPHLFVLFLARPGIERPESLGWREALVTSTLDELGAPWVSVRPAFLRHAALSGRSIGDYFVPPASPWPGHYDVLGNRVAFEVILEGLRTYLGIGAGGDLGRVETGELASDRLGAESSPIQLVDGYPALADRGLEGPYAILDPREGRPGEGAWILLGSRRRLSARAALVTEPADAEALARLQVEVDGALRLERELTSRAEPLDLDLDLRGANRLRIRAELERSSTRVTRLVLSGFQLEHDPDRQPIVPALR